MAFIQPHNSVQCSLRGLLGHYPMALDRIFARNQNRLEENEIITPSSAFNTRRVWQPSVISLFPPGWSQSFPQQTSLGSIPQRCTGLIILCLRKNQFCTATYKLTSKSGRVRTKVPTSAEKQQSFTFTFMPPCHLTAESFPLCEGKQWRLFHRSNSTH